MNDVIKFDSSMKILQLIVNDVFFLIPTPAHV